MSNDTTTTTEPAGGELVLTQTLREAGIGDDVQVVEEHGALLVVQAIIACSGCGTTIGASLRNEKPEDPEFVPSEDVICPVCTKAVGQPVIIPVMVLTGKQVQVLDKMLEEEGGPVAPVVPLRPVEAPAEAEAAGTGAEAQGGDGK